MSRTITSWQDARTKQFLASLEKPKTEPIQKDIKYFASLAVPPQRAKPEPAGWVYDRNEYVQHYVGSTYIAVSAIARRIAMQPVRVKRKINDAGDDQFERVESDHPLMILFNEVNPRDTQYDLWFHTVAWKLITGDAYWWKAKNGFDVPTEVWPIPSQWVRAIPSREKYIEAYEIRSFFGRRPQPILAEDIVHIREPNVDWSGNGRFYGYPVMKANARMVDIEEKLLARQYYGLTNYAPPGLHYSTEEEFNEDQVLDIRRQIMQQHRAAEQTGSPIITHSGVVASDFSPNPREMDYQSSLDAALDYTLAIHGVPKAIVGLIADVNRASMQGSMIAFADNTINPMLIQLGQALTQGLAHDFGEDLVIEFESVTINDTEKIRKDIEVAAKSGAITPNEIRQVMLEREPYRNGGDRAFVSTGFAEATFGKNFNEEEQGEDLPPERIFNGTQINAASRIVSDVALGKLTRDSGVGMLIVLLNLTPEQAEQVIGSAGTTEQLEELKPKPKEEQDNPLDETGEDAEVDTSQKPASGERVGGQDEDDVNTEKSLQEIVRLHLSKRRNDILSLLNERNGYSK